MTDTFETDDEPDNAAGPSEPRPSTPRPRDDEIMVKARDADMRLDRWFRQHFPHVSNGMLQKLVRKGNVRMDGKRTAANERVRSGAQIRVPHAVRKADALPERTPTPTPPLGLSKADRQLIEGIILFEDEDMLVLDKPQGLAVQGGSGTRRHIDGLLEGMSDRFGDRPRLVHRLDRDTTGVLLVAKSRAVAATLGETFRSRSAAKTYWALVSGVPKPAQGKIEAPLVKASGPDGDRVRRAQPGEQQRAMHATTHYSVIERVGAKAAWVSLKPVTGRQHQLRAHMASIDHPIVGDNKYEGGSKLPAENMSPRLHLHARRLVIPKPGGGTLDVTAPLPKHMAETFELLGLDASRYDAVSSDH
ncbi:MAG: RluA family pseudouridine synthase [Pseudomonadota bacterium]